jgi:putative phosphoribosyl transferase
MVVFRDRVDAGQRLGRLLKERGIEAPVVLGIPRGGVPIAAEVARAINGDLGVVVARKLGAPWQHELAIGAVTADGSSYINEELAMDVGATRQYLADETARQVAEARRREEQFGSHRRPALEGRVCVVVDDGIATGATAIAALRSMRRAGATKTILAIPVGAAETIRRLEAEADEVICLAIETDFLAIGQFYDDFRPTEDEDVKRILDVFAHERASQHAGARIA